MKSLFPKGKWFPRKGLPSPSIIYEINSFLMKVVPLSALEKMEHFGENFCSFLALLNGNSTTLSKWWCNLQKLFILVVALQKRIMGPARRWLPNSWKTSTDATVDECKKIGRNQLTFVPTRVSSLNSLFWNWTPQLCCGESGQCRRAQYPSRNKFWCKQASRKVTLVADYLLK